MKCDRDVVIVGFGAVFVTGISKRDQAMNLTYYSKNDKGFQRKLELKDSCNSGLGANVRYYKSFRKHSRNYSETIR